MNNTAIATEVKDIKTLKGEVDILEKEMEDLRVKYVDKDIMYATRDALKETQKCLRTTKREFNNFLREKNYRLLHSFYPQRVKEGIKQSKKDMSSALKEVKEGLDRISNLKEWTVFSFEDFVETAGCLSMAYVYFLVCDNDGDIWEVKNKAKDILDKYEICHKVYRKYLKANVAYKTA
ncbi:MAG: hypothetical protein OXB93_03765, partial [Cytophagales bacterium]|nr:hypothetical protein [Cytophagales bacterium]